MSKKCRTKCPISFGYFAFTKIWFGNIEIENKKVYWGAGGQKGRFRGSILVPRNSENVEMLSFWCLVKSIWSRMCPYESVWYFGASWSFQNLLKPSWMIHTTNMDENPGFSTFWTPLDSIGPHWQKECMPQNGAFAFHCRVPLYQDRLSQTPQEPPEPPEPPKALPRVFPEPLPE